MEPIKSRSIFSTWCCLQDAHMQNSDKTVTTTESTAHTTRRIIILSGKCGDYPLIRIYGISSLTIRDFYDVLKRRLHCLGRCSSHKIELFNTCAEDVVRVLAACDFPKEYMTVREI
ncbi:hypothetical protein VMCG_05621 [Cytospora schulzeri]|uniref:Uncharacterized protein n=1 Tax=Cytospora schulzeri TaxID=448051 RepID=A0A423WF05_9PEZI|nr:hypothetical protein VMCG_05621 [Valsa malicola]